MFIEVQLQLAASIVYTDTVAVSELWACGASNNTGSATGQLKWTSGNGAGSRVTSVHHYSAADSYLDQDDRGIEGGQL